MREAVHQETWTRDVAVMTTLDVEAMTRPDVAVIMMRDVEAMVHQEKEISEIREIIETTETADHLTRMLINTDQTEEVLEAEAAAEEEEACTTCHLVTDPEMKKSIPAVSQTLSEKREEVETLPMPINTEQV